jgi:MiaB-like tRNA modifying enzyme
MVISSLFDMMTKVKILTYGCAMNKADSEFMAGLLGREGFGIGEENADIIIINTCTVKTPTERKILRKLKELERGGKKVLVTGCLPSAQPEISKEFKKFSFLGVNVFDVVNAVKSMDKGKRFVKISEDSEERKDMNLKIKRRKNPIREIISIAQGCVGNCSYCIVKEARGRALKSIPSQEIVKDICSVISKEGVKEIFLTAQDTGAYGLDIQENLPSLLKKVSKVPGKFFFRVGMMNPNHAKKFLNDLILAYKNEKIYKFLHIPVQSGDNEVLKMMHRQYEVEDFKKVVRRFREEIPKITISTDVIVGFPTESEEQFQNTVKLIQEVKPDVLNISRYWSRPKTKATAEKMKELPGRETKRRSRILVKLFKKIGLERNEKWIGWKGEVLVSELGKFPNTWIGRNFAYKPIILNSKEKNLLGKFLRVKIKNTTYYDLRGELL